MVTSKELYFDSYLDHMVVSCTPDLEFVVKVTPAFFIAKEEVLFYI